jgi:hypothetical protein
MRPVTWILLLLACAGIGVMLTPSLRDGAQGWLTSAPPVTIDPAGDQEASVAACKRFALVDHRGWTAGLSDADRYATADDALSHISECRDEALRSYDQGMLLSLRADAGSRLGKPGWRDDLAAASAPLAACSSLMSGRDDVAARECASMRDSDQRRL